MHPQPAVPRYRAQLKPTHHGNLVIGTRRVVVPSPAVHGSASDGLEGGERKELVERGLLERLGSGGNDLVLGRRSGGRSRRGLLLLLRELADELAEVLRRVEVLLDDLGRVDGLAVSNSSSLRQFLSYRSRLWGLSAN